VRACGRVDVSGCGRVGVRACVGVSTCVGVRACRRIGVCVFVPEGLTDRSLARSAWDPVDKRSRAVGTV
jgi:hypothetical protein